MSGGHACSTPATGATGSAVRAGCASSPSGSSGFPSRSPRPGEGVGVLALLAPDETPAGSAVDAEGAGKGSDAGGSHAPHAHVSTSTTRRSKVRNTLRHTNGDGRGQRACSRPDPEARVPQSHVVGGRSPRTPPTSCVEGRLAIHGARSRACSLSPSLRSGSGARRKADPLTIPGRLHSFTPPRLRLAASDTRSEAWARRINHDFA
jgi:hypothetical protein